MGKGGRGVSKFALVVSAVSAASWLTFEGVHAAKVDAGDVSDRTHVAGQREFATVIEVLLLDAREPYDELRRNFTCWLGCQVRCLEVLVSAVSASSWRFRGRGARARTCELVAAAQIERHESGAVGEWFERPWGEQ